MSQETGVTQMGFLRIADGYGYELVNILAATVAEVSDDDDEILQRAFVNTLGKICTGSYPIISQDFCLVSPDLMS